MTAYFIAYGTVKDEAKLARYIALSSPCVAAFGGRFIAASNAATVLLGQHDHHRCAVFTFPDMASCKGWFNSPTYRELWPLRQDAADFVFLVFEDPSQFPIPF